MFLHRHGQRERHALPAMAFGHAEPGPAAFDIKLVGLDKPRRQRDDAIGQPGVHLVTHAVERGKDIRRQLASFGEHGFDNIGRCIGKGRARGKAGQIGDEIEHETLFGGGGGIGHEKRPRFAGWFADNWFAGYRSGIDGVND